MDFLQPSIESEYSRWERIIGADDPYASATTVGLHQVMKAHFLIADFFADNELGRGMGGIGPRSVELLHSAIYRQFVSFGGHDKWVGPYEKLATLIFGLVKDHPFHDANKRAAFLVSLYQLDRLGRTPSISHRDFEDFIVDVADDKLDKYSRYKELSKKEKDPEIIFISDYLKRNTRRVDKRAYTVTYNELNQIIKVHGFELSNPSGNFIDVVRLHDRPKFLGILGPRVIVKNKISEIGFPGWKKQVGKGALKTVRQVTGLTAEQGCDSKVFFQGADSLHTLIDIYSDPLKRLADR